MQRRHTYILKVIVQDGADGKDHLSIALSGITTGEHQIFDSLFDLASFLDKESRVDEPPAGQDAPTLPEPGS